MLSKIILQKFTENTKKTIENAFKIASILQKHEVESEHLLIGIWQEKGSLGMTLLQLYNFQNKNTNKMILGYEKEKARNKEKFTAYLSLEAKKILKRAAALASQYSHKYIGTEHILYSILDYKDEKIDKILEQAKIDKKHLKKTLVDVLKDAANFPDPIATFGVTPPKLQENKRTQKSILSYFCINLTQLALENKIEPIIGRKQEIERVIHILNRKTKNNPILIGEPGVGKTAIIQGLALKIANGEAPDSLRNKQVLSLDLNAVVAGTMLRGDLEARLKEIIEEIKETKKVILFIDEIHNIVGAGSASGTMDAANILKPALSQSEIQCIGATTLDEYRRHIEKDRALERRFQPLLVKEITPDQAIKVIEGLKPAYEKYHNLKISEQAIRSAVNLSSRYVNDRYLPDKALDVIDETAARARSTILNPSPLQKQIYVLKNHLRTIEFEKEKSVINEDYQNALHYKNKQDKLVSELVALESQDKRDVQHIEITERDITQTIATMTGIPINEIFTPRNLTRLEKRLKTLVVGQDEAIKTICGFVKRANAGIANPNRPWGSFLFLGPTGVGKTELARKLAEELFGSKESFIKIDMSEFMEKHNVSRLIGSPPGYVGFEEGGKLTEKIRRNPYSLVLFDEIEKANPEVFNILLQILEDGALTDGRGNQVNFKNTLIIMTSNIGTHEFSQAASKLGFETPESHDPRTKKQEQLDKKYEEIKTKALNELSHHMRPELINRIDRVLVFKPLGMREIVKIVRLEIKNLASRLKDAKIQIDPRAAKILAEKSYNPKEGARAARRQIQTLIEEPLADLILESRSDIKEIVVKSKNGKIVIEKK